MEKKYLRDVENRVNESKRLDEKFVRLHDRFLAIGLDYKSFINNNLGDSEIFKHRDNVIFRLQSARFHFNLLLQFQDNVEFNLKHLSALDNIIDLHTYERQSAEEIYSLFDSMVYHVCSIFDYLFSLINFVHGETNLKHPKWNLFQHKKNIEKNIYCSAELIQQLDILDKSFVYPLITHRSHLIHTHHAVGNIYFSYDNNKVRFLVTDTLKEHFPDFTTENGNIPTTLAFAAKWLLEKSFKCITEVLFEIREDMKRNKKISVPLFFTLGENNSIQDASLHYWGNRNVI